ncbi:polysaccharide deacetylase family protein [Sphingomonas mollis]|uniref:Chitooligosaccharide deacetylase n=1 Tax=Sphingomonas mollis TaxID=2795726 RepID=A0ABS0XP26_9SPHN|nr:glycosyltransferase [Sphingomonas sp. BT553]MBJ6121545.1 glycosyltransferase [Sphingomonas sp. BT553]
MNQPIFYDATGRRALWVRGTLAIVAIAAVAIVAWLLTTVMTIDPRRPLRFAVDASAPQAVVDPVAASTAKGAWLPAAAPGASAGRPPIMAFYMPWDEPSRRSLADHVGRIDWLVPGLATVTGADHRFVYESDPALRKILAAAPRSPRLLPMVQNAREDGEWDGEATARLLADPAARSAFVDRLTAMVVAERGGGVMLDLESLPATAHPHYRQFLRDLRARFAPHGWQVAIAAPVADPDWDLAAYARVADRVVLMAYDEHWMGGEAGPIASQPWFATVVAKAVADTGRDKAIVAIGNYAYDWSPGHTEPLSIAAAWSLARQAGTVPQFDAASGNSHFAYRRDGQLHRVWLLDAVTAANQMQVIARTGAAAVALWRLGTEDPHVWTAMADGTRPDLRLIPAAAGVEVRGAGEVMRLDAAAADGRRTVRYDAAGLIRDAALTHLPTTDVVQRVGAHRKLVALTFDDGPDPTWTPRLLDVLKRERAPATFFVTGANALGQGDLLRRIVAEGSELGNHSTTHPDLGQRSETTIRLELNATERLVEGYTGRAMRLFRPPFLGDADPDRRDELHATRVAAGMGYLTVGLNVDPLDWQAPAAAAIVARTIAQVEAGTTERPAQIVLLHDAGGDRTQTLAALPGIIRGLRARGYDLVGVSRLAGLSRDQAMPPLAGSARAGASGTRGLFDGMAGLRDILSALFVAIIAIGIVRALALTALAWRARHSGGPPVAAPHLVPGFVSVLIPAFNEARVIETSVRRILASTGIRIEVIVIDDGSTDGTSDVVTTAFGIDPRVRLLTLENGGKARALNTALSVARGDVVIALDADTQFEADTVARLSRWFADSAIGAVAGNAKIGNAVNLITRWQAVEYVTAQNLERRALAALGAITVVPGAVGAWRRTALDEVGGYPVDTLAEDQDLTIAIQRAGWRVACDIDAIAWTEAPETARALFRQRFRWAYGTLQCLWKHRALIGRGRPRGLAMIGLPQAILFQLLFTLAAPLIDVALIGSIVGTVWRVADRGWALAGGDAMTVAAFWAAFTAIDLACGWVAFRLDPREPSFPAMRLLLQRFGYRQLLYAVVLRAVFAALTGPRVGWGKLERSGRVSIAAPVAVPMPYRTPQPLPKAA